MEIFKNMSVKLFAFLFKIIGCLVILMGLMFSIQTIAHSDHNHEKSAPISAQLIVLEVTKQGPQIRKLELNNGNSQVLYTVPKGDKLFQFSHASGKPEMLISYLKKTTGEQGIWKLSYSPHSEDSVSNKLVPILVDSDPVSWFFDPIYAPVKNQSDNGMYFISASVDEKTQRASKDLSLNYINLSSMEQKLLANNARNPRVSEQGRYLSWIQSSKDLKSVNVLDIKTNKSQTFSVESAKSDIRHAMINDHTSSLLFFTDKEQLNANSFFNNYNLLSALSIIKIAHAHTGHRHHDYFGWQLRLADENKVISDANTAQLWQVEDIRAFDISRNGKHAAWVNIDGLTIVDIDNQKTLFSINNPNFWKMRWIH